MMRWALTQGPTLAERVLYHLCHDPGPHFIIPSNYMKIHWISKVIITSSCCSGTKYSRRTVSGLILPVAPTSSFRCCIWLGTHLSWGTSCISPKKIFTQTDVPLYIHTPTKSIFYKTMPDISREKENDAFSKSWGTKLSRSLLLSASNMPHFSTVSSSCS